MEDINKGDTLKEDHHKGDTLRDVIPVLGHMKSKERAIVMGAHTERDIPTTSLNTNHKHCPPKLRLREDFLYH
jgi:hypothetical protein